MSDYINRLAETWQKYMRFIDPMKFADGGGYLMGKLNYICKLHSEYETHPSYVPPDSVEEIARELYSYLRALNVPEGIQAVRPEGTPDEPWIQTYICPECGSAPHALYGWCTTCHGYGFVKNETCTECDGDGLCASCGGYGCTTTNWEEEEEY